MEDGNKAGVSGTPANILINHRTGEVLVLSGAQPLAALKEAVDKLLSG